MFIEKLALWVSTAFLWTAFVPLIPGAELISALTVGSTPVDAPNIYGGYLSDRVNGVALDSEGNIYITGVTFSPTFPASTPIMPGIPGQRALMFVAKLTPDASQFVYIRRFAGAYSSAIQVDQAGNAYVAGWMNASGATLTDAAVSLQAGSGSAWNSFVLKLDASGSSVQYAAYIAGGNAHALAIDPTGNAYIAGTAYALDSFPVTKGAFQTSQQCNLPYPGTACSAAFVAKVNAAGDALVYSTLLSGSYQDGAASIAVDASGAAYVAGFAASSDFPVTPGAFQSQRASASNTPYDAFVTKLNPTGTALAYSTYLGGTTNDEASGIAVGSDGSAYVTGLTASDDFPVTPLAFQSSKKPARQAAFVTKFDPSGQRLTYSTLFGGSQASAIAVDAQGVAHITGGAADGLPVFRAFQPSFYPALLFSYTMSGTIPIGSTSATDAFAAALNETGSGLVYSTYLSSPAEDSGLAVTLGRDGTVVVAGEGPLSLGAKNPLSTGGAAFLVRLSPDGTPPYFTRQSITDGASFTSGLVAPGSVATIFCTDLTRISGIEKASGFPLPTQLAGIQVLINGIPAPLYSVSGSATQQQINLQVPFEASPDGDVFEVEVSQGGIRAWVDGLPIRSAAPGLFTIDGTYGVIQHSFDYSLVTPASPAHAGEAIILYGTGLGPVSPTVPSGVPAPLDAISSTELAPSITIGGRPAQLLFSGLAPGTVGLYQLNVLVPADSSAGDQDVIVSFPPYQECCVPGTISLETVTRDSAPVKVSLR